jgi:hypothetical protein
MADDEVDHTFLGKQIEQTRALVNDVRDDLTGMVKCEISGRLTHFETRMETKIGDEFDALRADLPNIIAETPREFTEEELRQISARMAAVTTAKPLESPPYAKIQITGGIYEIIDSFDVASITDCGVGDVEVTFATAEAHDQHSIPQLVSRDGSLRWKTVHHGPGSTRLQILDDAGEPLDSGLFKIWKS